MGKGLEKEESRATVIEVSKELAQTVIDALFDCSFDTYNNVQFIPFVKVDDSYDSTLKSLFNKQNSLCTSMSSITIKHLNYLRDDI